MRKSILALGAFISLFAFSPLKAQPYTIASVQKVSNLKGGLGNILPSGESLADRIKNIGDFDGDGVSDLVACAAADNDGGMYYGAFYILFMKSDGTVRDKRKISQDSGNLNTTFPNSSYFFGKSVVSIGDLDGDGVTDFAVGAAGANNYTGAVYILFMNKNATVKSYTLLDENNSYLSSYLTGGNLFGNEVCNIGDVNGDGVTDIAVGASYENSKTGATYILFMKSDGTIKGINRLTNGSGTLYTSDLYGNTLANLGDVDGDGVPDLAIGCQGRNYNTGVVFITLLKSDGSIKSSTTINGTGKDAITTEYGSFGVGLSALKDIDGDGINDLLVGASGSNDGGNGRGCAYVVCLTNDQHVKSFQKISYTAGMSSYIHDGDYFGSDVTVFDDEVNVQEQHKKETDTITRSIVVGARLDDDGAYDAGAFYVIKLKSVVTVTTTSLASYSHAAANIGAYPNPFSGDANIVYTSAGGQVDVLLSDLNGRTISVLQSGDMPAGDYTLKINSHELGLKPGIYLVQMLNNNNSAYVKLSVY